MISIDCIHLEDGPEDGRVLCPSVLKQLVRGEFTEEIRLYMEPHESPLRGVPFLLGSYQLREVANGIARYRWEPARGQTLAAQFSIQPMP